MCKMLLDNVLTQKVGELREVKKVSRVKKQMMLIKC